MALKTSFLDDEIYGASDVNKIIGRIVSQGVAPEYTALEDSKQYNLDRLNDLTRAYVDRGVAYQADTALKVVKSGTEYHVSPGTAFFGNGTVTEVVSSETVEPIPGTVSYIYMISDTSANSNYITVSESAPDYRNDTNIVPLASVDAAGNITDMRFYARGKLPGYQNEDYGVKKIEVNITDSMYKAGYFDVDLKTTHVSMIVACLGEVARGEHATREEILGAMVLDGDGKMCFFGGQHSSGIQENALYISYYGCVTDVVRLSGTTWRFYIKTPSTTDSSQATGMYTFFYV